MNKFLFIFLSFLLVITYSLKAQLSDERLLYQKKIRTYTKTKNTGDILLVSGLGVTAFGTYTVLKNIISTPGMELNNKSNVTIGAYVIGFGIDLIIGGAILNTVGNRKVEQYSRKLNNLSGGLMILPECRGLSLVYRF